ncbi:hypothetical protein ACRZ5S_22555 (plasmid) [Vibrio scophthalmi]|uniref:hypothetical protein n=1 Tax=Vibrio scophthalmi TaxID=45658 RepID=UPI003EB8E7F9
MQKSEVLTERKFTKKQALSVGAFATIVSGVLLHLLLTGDSITSSMDIPSLPYVIALFIGIAFTLRVYSVKTPVESDDSDA